ncbi:TIGR03936 family radical SAM-associated protein [Clostridium kluyveri]|uniref:Radical SAM protein n=1 Tax=Clostridium kluyveri TaxID=1534 RepID=A0A1L5F5G6_CLOKL|nr:TIGR03936 family radical SAM-associated protein [Clostridium kluyveri]APM38258.1 radical SAM protein [Clostridium kluyveri]UZQ51731.1 TIGR03936 family radical SAM-associated protein [Clostridium kluyveri]
MKEQYLIKFSKKNSIKFIGHLDLMRTIQRMIKRTDLPVEYSKGFNPHINMSIAQPLAVGIYSCGEYMDLYFEEGVSEEEILEKLNNNAPLGIEILKASKVYNAENKKIFKSMAAIRAAKYSIQIPCRDTGKIETHMKNLMNMSTWNTLKRTKKGEKETDIRKMVKYINYFICDNKLVLDTTICCGSIDNLSPELLSNHIRDNIEGSDKNSFINIMREEMYGEIGNKLIPLYEYVDKIH